MKPGIFRTKRGDVVVLGKIQIVCASNAERPHVQIVGGERLLIEPGELAALGDALERYHAPAGLLAGVGALRKETT